MYLAGIWIEIGTENRTVIFLSNRNRKPYRNFIKPIGPESKSVPLNYFRSMVLFDSISVPIL